MNDDRLSRRSVLGSGAGLMLSPAFRALANDDTKRFKVAACDWSLGQRGQLSALELARQIGLEGVQVSFSEPGVEYDLRQEDVRRQYQQAAERLGVQIASLAMGVLNSIPYASDQRAERWVQECIQIMPPLQQRVVLLAFFGRGDIKDKPELQDEVIRRLRRTAPQAEEAGVILGIESWLSAEEHLRILDAVGSPAVQVYYDTANMEKQGYDIYQEIRRLGRERICEFHCKENDARLGAGRIDFPAVKQAIDEIGYRGWLVIESSVGQGESLIDSYRHNRRYLHSIFP